MRIAVSADEVAGVAELIGEELKRRGHEVELFGALVPGERADWAWCSEAAARAVALGVATGVPEYAAWGHRWRMDASAELGRPVELAADRAAARALVERAVASGEVDHVLAHTLPGPNPSTGVLVSLGFEHTDDQEDPEVGVDWEWRWTRPFNA